jgi:hypothetical protein
MDNYYVLRRGKVFLDLHLDFRSAREWHNAGWEVCPQDSKEAARSTSWKCGKRDFGLRRPLSGTVRLRESGTTLNLRERCPRELSHQSLLA